MKILTTIYNKLWSSRDNLPDEWKKTIIVPILKPDKPANLISSYRPTALTSILAKIQERMILVRLNWYLENQNLLTEEHAGFRQNRSATYQLTKLTQGIKRAFNQQENVLAVFVDFSGTYDSIWRAKLIEKLKNMNIEGNIEPFGSEAPALEALFPVPSCCSTLFAFHWTPWRKCREWEGVVRVFL